MKKWTKEEALALVRRYMWIEPHHLFATDANDKWEVRLRGMAALRTALGPLPERIGSLSVIWSDDRASTPAG